MKAEGQQQVVFVKVVWVSGWVRSLLAFFLDEKVRMWAPVSSLCG
jgi:hypothetical protein